MSGCNKHQCNFSRKFSDLCYEGNPNHSKTPNQAAMPLRIPSTKLCPKPTLHSKEVLQHGPFQNLFSFQKLSV